MNSNNASRHPSSFKDPAGFLFVEKGVLYRQVNQCYGPDYTQLMRSGLYASLTQSGKLIPHEERDENLTGQPQWFKTLIPEPLPFVSYPYEWCFDQLKDAGLLTLSVLKEALSHGLTLKDASAYNVQFREGKPLFIDTLSFEQYHPEQPWVAYRQFCQHFLYPLFIEAYAGVDAIGWLSHYLDGIPAAVCARLLPWKSRWRLGVRLHVLLNNAIKKPTANATLRFNQKKLLLLVDHLEDTVRSLQRSRGDASSWADYYDKTILGADYHNAKTNLVHNWLASFNHNTILDLGANDGHYSFLAAERGNKVIAADVDPACIQLLYQKAKTKPGISLHPVVIDLSNPSPDLGFHLRERLSFTSRAKADLVLALALIHHLVIGKNIPLELLAPFFAELAPRLIIEFIPKEDEKTKTLLMGREHSFTEYTTENFERQFSAFFTIQARAPIPNTHRVLYLMQRI